MFNHVMVGASDLEVSKKFYDALLGTLGANPGYVDGKGRVFWMTPTGNFGITIPINGAPPSAANGGTIGFKCDSTAQVDAWHAAGAAAGGTPCEDPPGLRGPGPAGLYLAYLRDPDGNKLCAVHTVTG